MKPEDLAELSSEGLLIVRHGRVAYANSAAQALFASCGCASELVGQPLDALWEEGSNPVCDSTGARLVRTRETPVPVALEIRAGAAQPGDESGALGVRVVRAGTDPGAVHRHALLDAVIDEAPVGIEIVDPERMEYVDINEAAASLFGMSRQDALARGLRAMPTTAIKWLRREYAGLIAQWPTASTNTKEWRPAGGELKVVESTSSAVRVEGRWLIIVFSRDVTDERAEQQRLQRLEAAINEAGDAISVVDPQRLEYLEINEGYARMTGLTCQEIRALGPAGMLLRTTSQADPIQMPQDDAAARRELKARYDALIANYPEVKALEVSFPGVDGREMRIESVRRAFRSYGRWLIIVVHRDISARYAASQRLEHAQEELKLRMEDLARSNRDLEQFAYFTSHDLSEPLRMIASYTQLLERRYGSQFDEEAREFMGYIIEGTQRMRRLIVDLLSFSRAGRNIRMASMRLDEPLDLALANLSKAIADAGATIERPAALPILPCDRSAMMQLFQNLVGNALKFRGTQPLVVRIDAQEHESGWTISVQDNGIGIEPRYFDRIFVIFQRLHSRTAYEGTGIGLAICKRIVERHGGRITVESQPGQGTTFRFTLPLVQEAVSDEEAIPAESQQEKG